jgi:hypothetical protein
MHTPTVPLPCEPISELTAFDINKPKGLFAYRYLQANSLLELPDFGGGDMTAEQRRDALNNAVKFQKPLAAVSIFLDVVALEDFIRDFGAKLAESSIINPHFPNLLYLKGKLLNQPQKKKFKRPDTDPAGKIDPEDINEIFENALGIKPIPLSEFARLRDLAIIRHTVAHHAAVIRSIDIPRFQYYIVQPQLINPPIDFVKEALNYLYKIGRIVEDAIVNRIFTVLLPTYGQDWWQTRPKDLLKLIEFFSYFGFLETTICSVGYTEPGSPEHKQMKKEAAKIKRKLITRSIKELRERKANGLI